MARLFGFSLVLAMARRLQQVQNSQARCIDDDKTLRLRADKKGQREIQNCADAQEACTVDGRVGDMVRSLCCATCSAQAPSPSNCAPSPSNCDWENGEQYTDLEYGSEDGSMSSTQMYDLHTTEAAFVDGAAPVPLAVFVHGGSWNAGNKNLQIPEFMAFRQRGFHVANINYRLSKSDKYPLRRPINFTHPGHIEDVELAFTHFKSDEFVRNYNIDPEKIVAIGSSAGGHLVSLLGTRNGPGSAARVAAVVNFFGVNVLFSGDTESCNTTDTCRDPNVDPALRYLGCNTTQTVGSDCYKLGVDASPSTHVSAESSPFLSFYGTNDPLHEAGLFFQREGEATGGDYTFHSVECDDINTKCHNLETMLGGTTNGICNTDVMYNWVNEKLGLSVAGCSR